MASQVPLKESSNEDDIPLQDIVYEEDEYGYVDAKDKGVSKILLQQLPSRQFDMRDTGSNSDEMSDPSLRRRKSQYRTWQLKNATLTSHQVSADVDKIYELLNSDPDATQDGKIKTLREMHQSLTIKRKVKERLDADMMRQRADQVLDKLTRFKLQMNSVWHKFLYELKNMTYSLEPWHSAIKAIQGQFGSGVASYFIFLRWLLYLNISNFFIVFFFIFVPQLLYQVSDQYRSNSTQEAFSVYTFVTGSGWLSETPLYFGHYTNDVIELIPGLYYNMPLAYLFVIGVISVINLIAVSYSLTSSYQKNYIDTADDVKHKFCNKVFSAWDYSIETEEAARLRKIAFCNELKELLAFTRREQKKRKLSETIVQSIVMVVINIFCLGIVVGVSYMIYYLVEKKALKVYVKVLEDMTLALTVTFVSSTFYFLLKYCTKLEFYYIKKTKLYLTMIRAVILRTAMVGIIVYFWMISSNPDEQSNPCYETELGKEIYRLVLVNFFMAVIFFTLFGEFFRRLICRLYPSIKPPQFDVAFNTLDLIYYQTLIWIGTFCMPLAPLINMIILILLFYVKQISVVSNCRPPKRTWSVNEAQTFFLTLLFFMFLLSAFTVGYVLFAIKPSPCGPFRDYENTTDLIHGLFFEKGEEDEASEIVKYLTSPGVMFAFFCALCVVVYYMRAQAKAHISVVKIVREQLTLEGKDKVFLLKLFDEALAMHSQMNGKEANNTETPPRNEPSDSANQNVFINEGYNEYYNTPLESPPLPKHLKPGYMPANVPVNKQTITSEMGSVYSPPRGIDIKIRSPSSSTGDLDSPLRKTKGIQIPPHQPGFRHFLREDSPRITSPAKDMYGKKTWKDVNTDINL